MFFVEFGSRINAKFRFGVNSGRITVNKLKFNSNVGPKRYLQEKNRFIPILRFSQLQEVLNYYLFKRRQKRDSKE